MTALVNEFNSRLEAIKAWRHHLHKHPELSLAESETARYIADLVRGGDTTSRKASAGTESWRR